MSRFVSAGTTDDATEREREEAWQQAQQKIDAARQKTSLKGQQQEGGKSLYETLQANKAAKQEAFEESIKLKNQFQSLNEDDADFLESVRRAERDRSAAERNEMTAQIDAFRKLQRDAAAAAAAAAESHAESSAAGAVSADAAGARDERSSSVGAEAIRAGTETWAATGPRKRKKARDGGGIAGVKIRRTSSSVGTTATGGENSDRMGVSEALESAGQQHCQQQQQQHHHHQHKPAFEEAKTDGSTVDATAAASTTAAAVTDRQGSVSISKQSPSSSATGLGLAAYSSDEDD